MLKMHWLFSSMIWGLFTWMTAGGNLHASSNTQIEPITGIASASDTVNVLDWGAQGDGHTNDQEAIQKAILFSVHNGKVCFIPKTKKFYLVKGTIRVSLSKGQHVEILSNHAIIRPSFPIKNNSLAHLTAFKEQTVFSIGPNNLGKKAPSMSSIFDNNSGITVRVEGINIDGSGLSHKAIPSGFGEEICIGLAVSAENILIKNCSFYKILGNGVMAMGPRRFDCIGNQFSLVGGRGKTPHAFKIDNDQFGDAINISAVKDKGEVSISSCKLSGLVLNGRRSRCGITFNFSNHNYTANIKDCIISGYAKCLHIEEKAASKFNITGCELKDFDYAVANVTNNGTVCNFSSCKIYVSQNDGQDAAGAALLGLNYKSDAQLFFNNSEIDFVKSGVYQSVAPVRRFDHCVFNANNLNVFFADADSLLFNHCIFNQFGGSKKSFYRCCGGKMSITIQDSFFRNSGAIKVDDSNVKLNIINTPSIKL